MGRSFGRLHGWSVGWMVCQFHSHGSIRALVMILEENQCSTLGGGGGGDGAAGRVQVQPPQTASPRHHAGQGESLCPFCLI